MNKYKLNIEEVLNREVIIKATSAEEAIAIANKLYKNEEIILDYNDFVEYKITCIDKNIEK